MNFDFTGKTIVITGASKGIGLACARQFLDAGAFVVNISRTPGPLSSERYLYVQADVRDVAAITSWLDSFEKLIDVWINNAGVYPQSNLLDVSEADWDAVFSVNLKSMFFLSTAVASRMRSSGGVILQAASFAAQMPSSSSGVYAASKAAVVSLTKSMAAEWGPFGIRVNSYSPGVIHTPMTEDVIAAKDVTSPLALSRVGDASEVASVILFLCSDGASYITGSDVAINGGKFLIQDQ